jgi:hypothetical protein
MPAPAAQIQKVRVQPAGSSTAILTRGDIQPFFDGNARVDTVPLFPSVGTLRPAVGAMRLRRLCVRRTLQVLEPPLEVDAALQQLITPERALLLGGGFGA